MESETIDNGHKTDNTKKRALGMGLAALLGSDQSTHLLGEEARATHNNLIWELSLKDIEPHPRQPRKDFDETAIAQLADSIKQHGVIQPIIVNKVGNKFQIVAGERRYRASKIAGIARIPAIIRQADTKQLLEIAVMENIQRQDLTPLEEASAYQTLIEQFQHTHESLATRLGKSRSHISNMLRLLQLPSDVLEALHDGKISVGHAKIMLGAEENDIQPLLERTIQESLSVRQLEKLVKAMRTADQEDNWTADLKSDYMKPTAQPAFSPKEAAEAEAATYDFDINRDAVEFVPHQASNSDTDDQMSQVANDIAQKLQTPTQLSISEHGFLVIEIKCDSADHQRVLTTMAKLINR